MIITLCLFLMIAGILFLVFGIGSSVIFRTPWFIIPGGVGGFLFVVGFILYLLSVC